MYWIVNSIKSKRGSYLVIYTTATYIVISLYEKIFILPRLKEKMKQILIICNFGASHLKNFACFIMIKTCARLGCFWVPSVLQDSSPHYFTLAGRRHACTARRQTCAFKCTVSLCKWAVLLSASFSQYVALLGSCLRMDVLTVWRSRGGGMEGGGGGGDSATVAVHHERRWDDSHHSTVCRPKTKVMTLRTRETLKRAARQEAHLGLQPMLSRGFSTGLHRWRGM